MDLDTLFQHFAAADSAQARLVDANVGDEFNEDVFPISFFL